MSVGSGRSTTSMRSAPPAASARPSSARWRARSVTPRWPWGSMAGSPSITATTPMRAKPPFVARDQHDLALLGLSAR